MQVNLNDRQKEAVEYVGGPLLIIAGAGTGKTAVITEKILYLLKHKIAKPSEILALTFTDKAADEMQTRIDLALPLGHEDIAISTFHSFAEHILRDYGLYLGLPVNFELIKPAEAYVFLKQFIDELGLKELAPFGNKEKFLRELLKVFSRLGDEDISPEEALSFINNVKVDDETWTEESLNLYKEVYQAYKVYSELKLEHGFLDFDDLLRYTVKLLKKGGIALKELQKRFKFILVDEFQDTNFTQNEMLLYLTGKRKDFNITVVGDDDQSIYKFRGAVLSNIMQFTDVFPDAHVVTLNKNYRSKQEILDASYKLIQNNNPYRLEVQKNVDKKLIASSYFKRDLGDPVVIKYFPSDSDEAMYIAMQILALTGKADQLKSSEFDQLGQGKMFDLYDSNLNFSDIAVLVRNARHREEVIVAFQQLGIPYRLTGKMKLFNRNEVSILLSYLFILANYQDSSHSFNIIKHPFWCFTNREILFLRSLVRTYQKRNELELLELLFDRKLGETKLEVNDLAINEEFTSILKKEFSTNTIEFLKLIFTLVNNGMIKSVYKRNSVGELVYEFFHSSGLLKYYKEDDSAEGMFKANNIGKFFKFVEDFDRKYKTATVIDFVDYVEYILEQGGDPGLDEDILVELDAVTISTIHGSKGLEYPVVFIPMVVRNQFPGSYRSEKFPLPMDLLKEKPEDRDLTDKEMYLMEERRLFYVGLTRAKEKIFITGAKNLVDHVREYKPSQFIYEIINEDIELDGNIATKQMSYPYVSKQLEDIVTPESLIALDSLSYSKFASYRGCPRQFQYKYIFNIPTPTTDSLGLGNILHQVLQRFYSLQKKFEEGLEGFQSAPTIDDLLNLLEKLWDEKVFGSDKSAQEAYQKAQKILRDYYKKIYLKEDKNTRVFALEYPISFELEGWTILTKIDRLQKQADGCLNIYDYKLGKKKVDSFEKKIQLLIYKLAAESKGWKVADVAYITFEDMQVQRAKLTEKDVEKLKVEFSAFVKDIKNGIFKPTPSQMKCQWCAYKDICEDAIL